MLWRVLEFLFVSVFIIAIGVLFVSLSVMLGKYELISLVFVILVGAAMRPLLSEKHLRMIARFPILSEAMEIYDDLEKFYMRYPVKSIFYYMLYPISGMVSFLFSRQRAREELNAYFSLIKWIMLLLIIEGFASYFRVYQHFDSSFVFKWFYLELLSVYFLCNFFAVPVATTALRMSLDKKSKSLYAIIVLSCIVFSGSFYYFSVSAKYDNLITIHVTLDRKISETQYRSQLKEKTQMFLKHHCENILRRNNTNLFVPDQQQLQAQKINEQYQEHLLGICHFGENDTFYVTTTSQLNELWGMVFLPFRDSIVYIFHYSNAKLHVYDNWEDLSPQQRSELQKRWPPDLFELSNQKQVLRVMVDYMRNKMRKQQESQKKSTSKNIQLTRENEQEESQNELKVDIRIVYQQALQKIREHERVIDEEWTQILQMLEKILGLPFSNDRSPQHFRKLWNPQWKFPGFEDFAAQIAKLHQQNFRRDLQRAWKKYVKNRKKASAKQNFIEQKQALVIQALFFTQYLKQFKQQYGAYWQNRDISQFVVFSASLTSFDYARAVGAELVSNHEGKSPEVRKNIYGYIYEIFFTLLMLLFEVSMPIHIFLILYCHLQMNR
ncbi:hypothetical protein [Candidatus Uabimicrobium amorphum]|uniref:Uncharacterized protein n=1 Tax=Uabimicrobium amorphum TaxID=2596890 RepID=A0A5S9F5G9_UABAM|nr:hypothetical protein [Candidatus Uabimicrobium amorphum]BBM86588.1 hypothetical protein UABAM_04974 [Candidatus Uabimicrobium amorphum]